jgi:hypothetical protein
VTETAVLAITLLTTFGFMFFIFAYILAIYAFVFGIIILTLAGMAFWVFMLVDCLQKDVADFPEKDNWTLILIMTFVVGMSWLGALIYYVKVKRPSRMLENDASAEVQPPPQSKAGKPKPSRQRGR